MEERQRERVDKCWTRQKWGSWSWTSSTELATVSLSASTYPTSMTRWGFGLSHFTSKQGIQTLALEQAGILGAAIFGFK